MIAITQYTRLVVAAGLLGAGSAAAQGKGKSTTPPPPAPQAQAQPKALQMRVWVNNITKIYHCPGSSYYGNTRDGEFMEEAQARGMGFRALGRRGCGNLPSAARAPLPDTSRTSRRMVWVNTESGVYHCPNAVDWGTTRRGKYMTEAEASSAGHAAAAGRSCAAR